MPEKMHSGKAWFFTVLMVVMLAVSLPGAGLVGRSGTAGQQPSIPSGQPAAQGASALQQFSAGGHILAAQAGGVTIASASHALRIEFAGAGPVEPHSAAAASQTAPDRAGASPLEQVTWSGLWPGISLTYQSTPGGIAESVYTLAPGADPGLIRLHYNFPVTLNADGSLGLALENGQMRESAPLAWQDLPGGQRQALETAFRLSGGAGAQEVGFALGRYNPAYPVTIDPVISWTSFVGGKNDDDAARSIAVDASGNIYLAGYSMLQWGNPARNLVALYDAYVVKLDSNGARQWNAFLGGLGNDQGLGVALDGSGNVFVCGFSDAAWGTSQTVRPFSGGQDGFVAAVDAANGDFLWNTFLGAASGSDSVNGITVNPAGDIFVTGYSGLGWGSPVNAFTPNSYNAFVAKIYGTTHLLHWNTFVGGAGTDEGQAIAVSGSWLYVAGNSAATWGSPGSYTHNGGRDVFVAKFAAASGVLQWNRFLGGPLEDNADAIALDPSGNIYVAGETQSTWGAQPVRAYSGDFDGFAAKMNASGDLVWNTFQGNIGNDGTLGIAVDSWNVYLSGYGNVSWGSPLMPRTGNFPAFVGVLDATSGQLSTNTFLNGQTWSEGRALAVHGSDLYLVGSSGDSWGSPIAPYGANPEIYAAKLSLSAIFIWNTFMGGSDNDFIYAITADGSGNTYVTGYSNMAWSAPLTANPYNLQNDAFVAKLNSNGTLVWNTFLGSFLNDQGNGIALDGAGYVYVSGSTNAAWSVGSPKRDYSGGLDAFVAKLDATTGALQWHTFLGGVGNESANAVFASSNGDVYVGGYSSASWPGALPTRDYTGSLDAFSARLNSSGVLVWYTFLGGPGSDVGYDLTVNLAVGAYTGVYLVGTSFGGWTNAPVPLRPYSSGVDGLLVRLNPSTGAIIFLTYLGGSGADSLAGIVLDSTQNLLVAGDSSTAWGSNPVRPHSSGTNTDAFVARLDALSGAIYYLSFLGGPGSEYAAGLTRDAGNRVFLVGTATAPWGASARAFGGSEDVFVTGLNENGWLMWNLFLGGTSTEEAAGIAIDSTGKLYAAGYTYSSWAAGVNPYTGGWDGFVSKLDPDKFASFTPILRK